MTQHEKILRYLVKNRQMTVRDGVTKLYINWPHKRVRELEAMGVVIRHVEMVKDGVRFVVYMMDPNQERVRELLGMYDGRTA